MGKLISIRNIADKIGVPLSTLHYWERRGLLRPCRRGGQRYFDSDQFYRVALIKRWRETGLMSLGEIGELLDRRTPGDSWRDVVHRRQAALDAQIAQLDTARTYLDHLLACEHGDDLARCPVFRAAVGDMSP